METPAGGWFFVNSLLVAPELCVLVPLLLRRLLVASGVGGSLPEILGVFPTLATYVLPWAGWLLLIPLWTTARNLRLRPLFPAARIALVAYLLLHGSFLAYTVWSWVTGPGGGAA